jgi:hypothetical protein
MSEEPPYKFSVPDKDLTQDMPWLEPSNPDSILPPPTPTRGTDLTKKLTKVLYHTALKNLSNNKAPGPDNIPNELIKMLPERAHTCFYRLFQHMWTT